jgi:glucokinase
MAKEVIAFDIGGTNMRAAIVNLSTYKVSKYTTCKTPKQKKQLLQKVDEFIKILNSSKIKSIGIGFPGYIKNGKITKAHNLPSLNRFNLKDHLQKKYKKRIEIANDVACFAIAESKLGSKKKNFIIITLGTGIGGGIVINGENYVGKNGYAAEFGHAYFKGKEWETQWKKTKKRIAKELGKDTLVSDLTKKRDSHCREILKEAADYLGFGIATLITEFDPETVFIGGGVKESGSYFLNLIRRATKKYAVIKKTPPVKWITLKNSGILGAALLVR